ncbi:MAG: glycosyltransferase [Chloroflexi bacterium]|nr:glycosyltransferase [Chloroflexota bacterium]
MWLLEFLFFAMTLLIGWTLFGYLLYLWFAGLFRAKKMLRIPKTNLPRLSVIVPCYNEQEQILAKLDDLRRLVYPRDMLEVIFADGDSTDGTVACLTAAIQPDDACRVIRCPRRGKVHQLNHVLPMLRGEIVVNTDVDARLAPDALQWIAATFAIAPEIWVVGAYCRPADGLAIEQYYWDSQNKGRLLESDAQTASIVIAQCYAFRRELLAAFPEDVVADDVYAAFLANTLGYRTIYSRRATAIETRTPQDISQFVPHKFRKSNAYLRESLRFLYRLPEMSPFCKMMLTTRVVQQLLLPWAIIFWMLIAGVLLTLFRFDVVIFGALFLFVLLLLTNRVFAWMPLPEGARRYSLATILVGYALTMAIMLTTGVSYPFFRQGSSYARVGGQIAPEDKGVLES